MRTQVGIVGAGPAGLLLGQLLHLEGIDSIIIENRSEEYVIERVRAGVLEQGTVDLMHSIGAGERLKREGLPHDGIYLKFNGDRHRIDMAAATGGRRITVYGQNEVVKDLIAVRRGTGRPLAFEVDQVSVHDLDSRQPKIRYRSPVEIAHNAAGREPELRPWGAPRAVRSSKGQGGEISCDFIAGCDGFHGICRPSIPQGVLTVFEKVYPVGWLGILAQAAPSSPELVYSYHERGFALFSMRSPKITRLYLQVDPEEDIRAWPDDRIWEELLARLSSNDGWKPNVGPVLSKEVTKMRSFVAEPMRYGRLFLAGDAAHIVPPTGAKGLNLAAADVWLLSRALSEFYKNGNESLLDRYSTAALRRVWKYQRFSWLMTSMLHRFGTELDFDYRRQLGELDYVTSSRAAMESLSEQYVGTPFDGQVAGG